MSEGSYNLEAELGAGQNYKLRMTSDKDIEVSLIMLGKTFSHLIAGRTQLLTRPNTVFEIFTPNKSIMVEIFVCSGEVGYVEGSRNYTALTSSHSSIKMQHSNYGGHYVMSAEDVDGEYYVRVSPPTRADTSADYKIAYYFYDPS